MSKIPFLFEIGTEEIPAAFLPDAIAWLRENLSNELINSHLEPEDMTCMGAPRRLVFAARAMLAVEPDRTADYFGPPASACFDKEGNPTKAGLGFAAKFGIETDKLEIADGPKGKVVKYSRVEKGSTATRILSAVLPALLAKFPWPKSMRWGSCPTAFVRPIHWIAAMAGNETIPFDFADVKSSNKSRGHRFVSPEEFEIKDPLEFKEELRARGVMLDGEERREAIRQGLTSLSQAAGGKAIEDEELVEHTSNIVEWPHLALGRFDEKYLALPKELLVITTRTNQKYFNFEDSQARLLPVFCAVLNVMPQSGPDKIIFGNERVLKARLEDAAFVVEEDKKKRLDFFADELNRVTFHRDLGSVGEKVARFTAVAKAIAKNVGGIDETELSRACATAKADLNSRAVFEFPELQGIMGAFYARLQGEKEVVADAVEAHWKPKFSADEPAKSRLAAIVAIADKLDTIVGCFAVGIKPTGAKDAFGLRRNAIGVVNTILFHKFELSLKSTAELAFDELSGKEKFGKSETIAEVMQFFKARFEQMKVDKGTARDVAQAALEAGFDSPLDADAKVSALDWFSKLPEYEKLAAAFKRVGNILSKQGEEFYAYGALKPRESLFEQDEERALFEAIARLEEKVKNLSYRGLYREALAEIAAIKEPVDAFFDKTLVMCENADVRRNRLALLESLRLLFADIADFRKLSVK